MVKKPFFLQNVIKIMISAFIFMCLVHGALGYSASEVTYGFTGTILVPTMNIEFAAVNVVGDNVGNEQGLIQKIPSQLGGTCKIVFQKGVPITKETGGIYNYDGVPQIVVGNGTKTDGLLRLTFISSSIESSGYIPLNFYVWSVSVSPNGLNMNTDIEDNTSVVSQSNGPLDPIVPVECRGTINAYIYKTLDEAKVGNKFSLGIRNWITGTPLQEDSQVIQQTVVINYVG